MRVRLIRPDARTVAVVAALATVSLLVALVASRRQDLLGVALALLCVLLATVAGVSGSAARQRPAAEPTTEPVAGTPSGGLYGIDADTLETLDDREAVRLMRERRRGRAGSATGEGG